MVPERRLLSAAKAVSRVNNPICVGKDEENEFEEICKLLRRESRPTCEGIGPVKELLLTESKVKAVSCPIWDAIVPANPDESSEIRVVLKGNNWPNTGTDFTNSKGLQEKRAQT